MKKYLLALSIVSVLSQAYGAEAPEHGNNGSSESKKTAKPRDAKGRFVRKCVKGEPKNKSELASLVSLKDLDPKRDGAWYTQNELGAAASILQGVMQSNEFLIDRSPSEIKKDQAKRLANYFGEKRGTKLFNAILIQETSMDQMDLSAMKNFIGRVHENDKADFEKYVKDIESEIPTVDQENLEENASRYEATGENPISMDNIEAVIHRITAEARPLLNNMAIEFRNAGDELAAAAITLAEGMMPLFEETGILNSLMGGQQSDGANNVMNEAFLRDMLQFGAENRVQIENINRQLQERTNAGGPLFDAEIVNRVSLSMIGRMFQSGASENRVTSPSEAEQGK